MSERLLSGRFTKEQSFSRADNFKNTKSSISDPLICDRLDDTNYVLDHTYALPIATEPYIINNKPFSIYSEIEVNTEVNAVQNEVLFDYIPSDLVPLSHCRFIVDFGFMAEQLKHCQFCQSTLHVYYALRVRTLGFSSLMSIEKKIIYSRHAAYSQSMGFAINISHAQ